MTTVSGVAAGAASARGPESFPSNAAAAPPRVPFRSVLLLASSYPPVRALGDPLRRALAAPSERSPGRGSGWTSTRAAPAPVSNAPRQTERAGDDDRLDAEQRRRAAPTWHDGFALSTFCGVPNGEPPADRAQAATPAPVASLEELFPVLVRRIAWSSDGERAAVRLELGAGELAGGTLLVQTDAGRVRVHLELPPGVDGGAWRRRICDRLAARGLPVDAVEVA